MKPTAPLSAAPDAVPLAERAADRPAPPAREAVPPVLFDRRTPPAIITLVLASAVGPLAMNIFLPSLPGIAAHFHTDYASAQLAVTGYLLVTALVQLIAGPLADRYGRRPVLLGALAIFLVSTVGAILAPSIEIFLLCRALQAAATAGIALSRAIVRDMVAPEKAAAMIGYVTMGMALVPMVGPMIGGGLEAFFGWQASFVALLIFGSLSLAVVWADLGETNRHAAATLRAQLQSYPELLRSRRFWGYALAAAFASGAYFAYLGGAPYVALNVLGLTAEEMGLYFGVVAAGYIGGNYLSARYSERLGLGRMIYFGAVTATAAMCLSTVLFMGGALHALTLFGPVFFVGLGNGMTLPNANAGLLSARPHLAGGAAGLGGALMIGGGAALSAAAGWLLSAFGGGAPLTIVMAVSSAVSLGVAVWTRRIEAEVAAEEARAAA